MTILTKDPGDLSFLVSEASGHRSREVVTVDASGGALVPGTILGKVTSSGKYVQYAPGATDGSETVAGVLGFDIGAEEAERTIIIRDAEVAQSELTYESGADAAAITAANAGLAALGIIVR